MEGLYLGHGSGYKHCGRKAKSSIKLQTLYNYSSQTIDKIDILEGKRSDQGYRGHLTNIEANELLIADLGYFVPTCFKLLNDKGAYFISRYKSDTNTYDKSGNKFDLCEILQNNFSWQGDILLGKTSLLPVRMVCRKLTKEQSEGRRRKANNLAKSRGYKSSRKNQELLDWSIFITNIPEDKISIQHIPTIYRTRWQIELLFKLYKSHFKVESLKGKDNSSRIICELYAKLCAILLFHSTFNCMVVKGSREISLTKAFLEFQAQIRELMFALNKSINRLANFFRKLFRMCSRFCLKDKYRKSTKTNLFVLPPTSNSLT